MRKLSGKTINSLALCVALAAPLVYLFGTLFTYLAGAHGNMQLANDEQNELVLTTNDFIQGYTTSNDLDTITPYQIWAVSEPYLVEEGERYTFVYTNWSGTGSSLTDISLYDKTGARIQRLTQWGNSLNSINPYTMPEGTAAIRIAYYCFLPSDANYMTFDKLTIQGTTKTLTKPSDYLFSQFFTYDNFLAESGREVLNGTPLYGFEPIGELIRYTDVNMLHLGNLSYGPLVIGYTYYCAHVIIVDLIFYIGSFIPRLIKKTINKLEGGLD